MSFIHNCTQGLLLWGKVYLDDRLLLFPHCVSLTTNKKLTLQLQDIGAAWEKIDETTGMTIVWWYTFFAWKPEILGWYSTNIIKLFYSDYFSVALISWNLNAVCFILSFSLICITKTVRWMGILQKLSLLMIQI